MRLFKHPLTTEKNMSTHTLGGIMVIIAIVTSKSWIFFTKHSGILNASGAGGQAVGPAKIVKLYVAAAK
jgi:hypothetical protein